DGEQVAQHDDADRGDREDREQDEVEPRAHGLSPSEGCVGASSRRSARRGLSPATQAALAVAWVAVGPVKNRNSPMIRSLTVISVKPDWMARPMMSSSAPKVSVTPPACSRV